MLQQKSFALRATSDTNPQNVSYFSVGAFQDGDDWIFSVRKFETLPERTTVVNYDGFAEGIFASSSFHSDRECSG